MSAHHLTTADIDAYLSTKKPRGRPAAKKAAPGAAKRVSKKVGRPAKSSTGAVAKGKMPAKYLNPKTGETWSGHARPPAWIKDVKDRSKFLIDGAAPPEKPAVLAKKAAARVPSTKRATARTPAKTRTARGPKPKVSESSKAATESVTA